MSKTTHNFFLLILLSSTLWSLGVNAQEKQRLFIDSLDNAFDVSHYLYDLHGFLPIASPITEPAVGYGAAAAGIFFIPKEKNDSIKFQMPDVAGFAGGLTENNTWFAGGGYFGFWKNDQIRYRGVFGYGDVKLKYFGTRDIPNIRPVNFRIQSYFFLQQVVFRLGGSNFFLGGKYQLGKSNITLFEDSELIEPRDRNLTNSGIGIITEYEDYDNVFSPTDGIRINITYDQFLEFLGGDRDFGRITTFMHYYKPLFSGKLISGLRVESQIALGDNPFYMLPFIYLRGVPAMRYQGELTALIETEQQFMITKRWSVVGFAGYGRTAKSLDQIDIGSNAWNAGTGFRYLIARAFGLRMGADIARGPEQWAFYIVVGSSWIK